MGKKKCSQCKKRKPLSEFYRNKFHKDGHTSQCKGCTRLKHLEWRKNNREKSRAHSRKKMRVFREKNPELAALRVVQCRAKRKSLACDLSLSDIVFPAFCPVLGIAIAPSRIGTKHRCDNSPSVDRIDNRGGYTKDNIVIISNRANRIKSDATSAELRKIAEFYDAIGAGNSGQASNRKSTGGA